MTSSGAVVVPDNAAALVETPEWDGPDPREWSDKIVGFREGLEDLKVLKEVIEELSGASPANVGAGYLDALDFLRAMQDQRKAEVADLIRLAHPRIPG